MVYQTMIIVLITTTTTKIALILIMYISSFVFFKGPVHIKDEIFRTAMPNWRIT